MYNLLWRGDIIRNECNFSYNGTFCYHYYITTVDGGKSLI